uniref:AAA family ATPase n=1 Tax=Micromonospora carbonacea TaxID=47853 RepID=A0A7D6GK63_9ACTN|nr:AAA family ATPase [Micromonospora carbonacea]
MIELRLLERDEEMSRLERAFAAATRGRGSLVAVVGPAGIGKSTLLGAARARASATGCRVLTARGSQLEQNFAFGVVRQLVEPVLMGADTAERVRLLRGAAHRAAALLDAQLAGPPPGDLTATNALYQLLVNLTGAGPVALVIDDLHWADDASVRFLVQLGPRLADLPLAVVLAGRPGERVELATGPASTILRPALLTPDAVAQLVRSVTDGRACPRLSAACHALTGGNPLFVRELAHAAQAAGGAAADGDEATLRAIAGTALEHRIPAVLANLTPEAVQLARAAAVLGDEADPALVVGLTGDPTGLPDRLAELIAAGILCPDHPVTFGHALTRDAVYAVTPPVDRSRLHRRAAELLDAAGQPVPLVATHLLATLPAGDAWVVRILVAAAHHALSRASPRSALTFLERAIQEPPATAELTADLIRQAGSCAQGVSWPTAITYLRRAAALAGGVVERARIVELLGRATFLAGRNAESISLLERTLTELGGTPADLDHRLRTVILAAAAADLDLRHTGARHLAVLRAAPELSDEVRFRLNAFLALWTAVIELDRDASVAAALRVLDGPLAAAPDQGASSALLAYLALIQADHDDALSWLDRASTAARESGQSHLVAMTGTFRAYALLRQGKLKEAGAAAREAAAVIDVAPATLTRVYAGSVLAEFHLACDELTPAARALAWAGIGDPPGPAQRSRLDLLAARLDLANGLPEAAVRRAEDVGRLLMTDGWLNPAAHPWRSVAALARHALGHHDEARALALEELDLARRWGAPQTLGAALRTMATVTGGPVAPELLAEAVAVLRTSPARLELAEALHAYGRSVRLRHPGAALAASTEALEIARACGAEGLARRVAAELAESATPAEPPHGALTAGEWRVARLALSGRTNHQIAQELHVTPKTVETHLSSVYRKLGVRNRTAMARLFADHEADRAG